MSISNVLDSFDPIVRQRNYAPTRTFVTKWDVEIDRNRVKKINRARDRSAKYFDDFDHHADSLPPIPILCEFENSYDCGWELESDDDDGDETNHNWLRSLYAENAYFYRHTLLSKQPIEITRKRFVHFEDDQSLFKRGRL
jgi:hypothetical protein